VELNIFFVFDAFFETKFLEILFFRKNSELASVLFRSFHDVYKILISGDFERQGSFIKSVRKIAVPCQFKS